MPQQAQPIAASTLLNFDLILSYLVEVCEEYEKSAPAVSRWADELYTQLNGSGSDWRKLTLDELTTALDLRGDEGRWVGGNLAANLVYKLLDRLGRDTTGLLGF